ncbi:MAG: ATPase, T2SS/T4P/T4SS family [Zavarzinella sp.]
MMPSDSFFWAVSVPRGDTFLFHHGKIFVYLGLYLLWIKTIAWIDRDGRIFELERGRWNTIALTSAVVSLVLGWLVPIFAVALVLSFLVLVLVIVMYVHYRNPLVPAALQVFTKPHMLKWLKSNLGIQFQAKESSEQEAIPLQFIGKMQNADEFGTSNFKSMNSEGYRVAQEVVWNALNDSATDIHFEPSKSEMTIRYRIDGMLQFARTVDARMGVLVLNVYKNLAGMDIAERRKPQDGSFSAKVRETHVVDFRVATSGSVTGEKLVMRVLDSSKQMTVISQLGLREQLVKKVVAISRQSHGMFITCGPTGAGKTSSLYACINMIDRQQRNVITLENPVEYLIDHVTQIEVNPKAGKTFAAELRSILRQDPDVILIGEIRDTETAEIACQAAQTGHLVLTTIHANDSLTALGRLQDLGVKPFLLANAISAILGQRLARVLCPKCRIEYPPSVELLKKLKLPEGRIKRFYRAAVVDHRKTSSDAKICNHCHGTGYCGRTGIFEFLTINEAIRGLITEQLDIGELKKAIIESGYYSLHDDAMYKVLKGITSVEEVQRVVK